MASRSQQSKLQGSVILGELGTRVHPRDGETPATGWDRDVWRRGTGQHKEHLSFLEGKC